MLRYYIRSYETVNVVIYPVCSKVAGHRIDQSFTILDMKHGGISMITKKVYSFIKLAINMAQDNYPECLGKFIF